MWQGNTHEPHHLSVAWEREGERASELRAHQGPCSGERLAVQVPWPGEVSDVGDELVSKCLTLH